MDLVRRKTRKSREVPARRANRGRFAAVWLAIFALTLHGLVPLAQGIPAPERASGLPSTLILCTALAAESGPAEDGRTPTDSDRRSCPVCQINAIGKTFLPILAEAPPPPPPEGLAEWRREPADSVYALPSRSWQARAPPAVV
jgi:hypothetical protein